MVIHAPEEEEVTTLDEMLFKLKEPGMQEVVFSPLELGSSIALALVPAHV